MPLTTFLSPYGCHPWPHLLSSSAEQKSLFCGADSPRFSWVFPWGSFSLGFRSLWDKSRPLLPQHRGAQQSPSAALSCSTRGQERAVSPADGCCCSCSLPSSLPLLTFPLQSFGTGGVGGTTGEPPLGTETLVGPERGRGDALPSLLPSLCLCLPARASQAGSPACLSVLLLLSGVLVAPGEFCHLTQREFGGLSPPALPGRRQPGVGCSWLLATLPSVHPGELHGAIARLSCSQHVPAACHSQTCT